MHYTKIGQAVRAARTACGVTQDKLAADLDIDQGHLSKFERGLSSLSTSTIERIFEHLGLCVVVDEQPHATSAA